MGVESDAYFFPSTLSTTKKANNWESNKGQPAETINTKVQWESKLNLSYVKPISDPFS